MKSIRGHLLAWFLPGFVLVWIAAGGASYYSARSRHEGRLDYSLREMRSALPVGAAPDNPAGGFSLGDLDTEDLGLYFQIRSPEGSSILKSENLGRFELPFHPGAAGEAVFRNAVLANGDPVRLLSERSEDGALGPVLVTVAVTREEMIAAMRETGVLILVMGVISGSLFAILLAAALRSGLAPLRQVGSFATSVDADSLSRRLPEDSLPRELRPIAASLNTLMDRLETSFDREKRFGADLAHEFRTPLAAIRTTAEVALRFPPENPTEAFHDIVEVSGTLQATIENLLTLTKISGRAGLPRQEPVSLEETVSQVWRLLEARSRERGLTLVREQGAPPALATDPDLLRLILANLLGNAVDYAPENGSILVKTGGGALFSVSNAAPHLSEEDLPRLFERLWRHDAARSDSNHSGLGLSLARSCAGVLGLGIEALLREGSVEFRLSFKNDR